MIKTIIATVMILIEAIAFGQNHRETKKTSTLPREQIIQALTTIYKSIDERNWEKVESLMADTVHLDFASMGGTNSNRTPRQITDSWKNFVSGFDKTHHQLSNFEVSMKQTTAAVHYLGKADHIIGKEMWTLEGTYDTELELLDGKWLVTNHKFNLTEQSGNRDLRTQARKIVEEGKQTP